MANCNGNKPNVFPPFYTCYGATGPTGPTGPTGATERLFKSSNKKIIDSS